MCSMSTSQFDQLHIFEGLTPLQNTILRNLFIEETECSGTIIFDQGDPAEYLYLVADGEVLIRYKPDDGPLLTVARVKQEGVVGWSAALGSPAYTSSAVCSTDCTLLRISSASLRELCNHYPDLGGLILERLANIIAKRLRNTHPHVMALLEQGLHVNAHRVVPTNHY